MSDLVHTYADQLRQYATHFAMRDWNYTRQHDIRHIRLGGDWSGYHHPLRRMQRWLNDYVKAPSPGLEMIMGRWFVWRHPIIHARVTLRTDANLPDGVLDNGGVIVHWEETGEYLQYVQPSVGEMLADWMDADPDSPHAQRIAAEMKRINDAYGDRIAAEGDDQ